jgi:hypothetical protein
VGNLREFLNIPPELIAAQALRHDCQRRIKSDIIVSRYRAERTELEPSGSYVYVSGSLYESQIQRQDLRIPDIPIFGDPSS